MVSKVILGILITLIVTTPINLVFADKPPLILGYSTQDDGGPVSGLKNGRVTGFCGKVQTHLEQFYSVTTKEIATPNYRFGMFAEKLNKQIGVQCGPSSKTFKRQQELNTSTFTGQFSEIFFTTQTKVLIHRDSLDDLYSGRPVKIGILEPPPVEKTDKTASVKASSRKLPTATPLCNDPAATKAPPLTTKSIAGLFPHVELVELVSRAIAVEQLKVRTIVGYASDGLLLEDILRESLDNSEEYSIEPPLGSFLREDYVLVIYNPDSTIVGKLNEWLKQAKSEDTVQLLENAREGSAINQWLQDSLFWLNRSDHLVLAQTWLGGGLLLVVGCCIALTFLVIKRMKRAKTRAVMMSSTVDSEALLNFSKDLHDDIGQLLVASKRFVESMNVSEASVEQKTRSLTTLDDAIQKVRHLSHHLKYLVQDELDDWLLEFHQRTHITTTRTGDLRWSSLPKSVQSSLSFVIKEALTNVERHANAHEVEVDLIKTRAGLSLVIYDDGRGRDAVSRSGAGLAHMRRRIEQELKGSLLITSGQGQGTTLRIEVPFAAT